MSESADEQDWSVIKNHLKGRHYQIREENGDLLAEKGRFSRWGPYINHVGLIIFLIGAMLRFIPGFYVNEDLWVKEGETAVVPETNEKYYIKIINLFFSTTIKTKIKRFKKQSKKLVKW